MNGELTFQRSHCYEIGGTDPNPASASPVCPVPCSQGHAQDPEPLNPGLGFPFPPCACPILIITADCPSLSRMCARSGLSQSPGPRSSFSSPPLSPVLTWRRPSSCQAFPVHLPSPHIQLFPGPVGGLPLHLSGPCRHTCGTVQVGIQASVIRRVSQQNKA